MESDNYEVFFLTPLVLGRNSPHCPRQSQGRVQMYQTQDRDTQNVVSSTTTLGDSVPGRSGLVFVAREHLK